MSFAHPIDRLTLRNPIPAMFNTRRILTVLTAFLLLVGMSGCTDVSVNPKSSSTANNTFSEDGAYKSYLAKLYGGLAVVGQSRADQGGVDVEAGVNDNGWTNYTRIYWALQELPTDAAVITWNDQTIQDFNDHSWDTNDPFVESMYSRIFFQVAQVNEFLRQSTDDMLDERNVDAEVQEAMPQWRAEARFLRALSYWHAVDIFGGVPLVEEDFPRGAQPPESNTRQEVFNFVEQELLEITGDAEGDAPEEVLLEPGESEYGRVDKAAAWMVLAKLYQNAPVYIGENRSSDVVDYTSRIIDSGVYNFDPQQSEYQNLFLADNRGAKEFIFAVPADGQNTRSFGGTTFLAHASVGGSLNQKSGQLGLDTGWFGLRTLSASVDKFSSSDTRPMFPNLTASETNSDGQWYTDGQSKSVTDLRDFSTGYLAPKYQNVTSGGATGSDQTFVDIDYPMFRIADAYLMYAEAVVRGGGGSQDRAETLLNDIRERAGLNRDVDLAAQSQQENLDFILDARARELFWEGHRRTDLIRFGRFSGDAYTWAWKGGEQGGTSISDCLTLYPIPNSELEANPNMSQIQCYQ